MTLAIWALTVFTALLFGSTMVNVLTTRQVCERTQSQIEAIRTLNDSLLELRKSFAEFSSLLQEAQEFDQGADESSSFQKLLFGDEKV